MKLCIKRIYCDSCQKLVRGQERKNNDHLELICPKCNRVLWAHNGRVWRYATEAPK